MRGREGHEDHHLVREIGLRSHDEGVRRIVLEAVDYWPVVENLATRTTNSAPAAPTRSRPLGAAAPRPPLSA
ncbi:hypothetical protein SGFS_051940 [Streptomyces graminofaciens]|uniref:Transposase n=1 Tax=Streptomyces graminofaciens TaxID=68212 RepID=A0ABN5VKX9_9ACTN|nr:hypothetical protein SGFS_051940 [Streptomyces graminofaciens]